MSDLDTHKQAACIILMRHHSTQSPQILACSRKNDLDDFGLPGGKVDGVECARAAALREFEEETGIVLSPVSMRERMAGNYDLNCLTPAYVGMCWEKDRRSGYMTTAFLHTGNLKLPILGSPLGLDSLEGYPPAGEGVLAWKTPRFLANNGSFKDYNLRCFRHMDLV